MQKNFYIMMLVISLFIIIHLSVKNRSLNHQNTKLRERENSYIKYSNSLIATNANIAKEKAILKKTNDEMRDIISSSKEKIQQLIISSITFKTKIDSLNTVITEVDSTTNIYTFSKKDKYLTIDGEVQNTYLKRPYVLKTSSKISTSLKSDIQICQTKESDGRIKVYLSTENPYITVDSLYTYISPTFEKSMKPVKKIGFSILGGVSKDYGSANAPVGIVIGAGVFIGKLGVYISDTNNSLMLLGSWRL
jgi:hypothetical protein